MDRSTFGGDASGDTLSELDANLRPQLGFDALCDSNAKHVCAGIEEHKASAFSAGDSDCDLKHALEEFVRCDGHVDRLDDLMQRLQEFCFAIPWRNAVTPK